jgi:hypothetical protein
MGLTDHTLQLSYSKQLRRQVGLSLETMQPFSIKLKEDQMQIQEPTYKDSKECKELQGQPVLDLLRILN